jgi:hypothetical protein
MSTAPPPATKKPPAPAAPPPSKQVTASPSATPRSFSIKSGPQNSSLCVGLYGTGGIGKTKLATLLRMLGMRVLVVDLEQGSHPFDVDRVDDIEDLQSLRDLYHSHDFLAPYDAIVTDSETVLERLSVAWTIANCPHPKSGKFMKNLSAYGFGDGESLCFDTHLMTFGDRDALRRRGKHIINIAHECRCEEVNSDITNYIRREPRLQTDKKGKSSIRNKWVEWHDTIAYIRYDVFVDEQGKTTGSGSRTIYCQERPGYIAKSRTLDEPVPYNDNDPTFWQKLLGAN